ncbi:MAG: two-component system, OmpR family, sensor histidine kinase BaeS [Actinomycetota bacterium]|nr:two-component system, OmpR family, sensor histidine kinase BaeS [Actinomycetota bacterium]
MPADPVPADPVPADQVSRAPATRSGGPRRSWSLRLRLLVAFVTVAAAAVALVTAAALVGTSAGLSAQERATRDDTLRRAGDAAVTAYRRAQGWDAAVLTDAVSVATGAGARLIVRDADGLVVRSTTGMGRMNGSGNGIGRGPGQGAGNGSPMVRSLTADGATVGSVTLVFTATTATAGRPVAWRWIGIAAVAAIALASAAAWLLTRSLTRPLAVLTGTAKAFAGGDRGARTHLPVSSAPDELATLAATFDEAAEQIQVSEQARRQMAADVAHELRTPLAALQAGLEELRDGLAPADTAALARLHDQSLRLGRVVTDLADLSAADAARLTLRPEPADLTGISRAAAQAHEARLRAAGLTLITHLEDAVPVHADPGRLDQVVGNLLQNCARHCREGDTVTLTTATAPDGRARLTVADTGPGIPPADLPHVFTRFWSSGTGGGSGLGMPIVKSLVEAHGGTIEITSDGRHGTTVTIGLPARPTSLLPGTGGWD